MYLVRLLLNCEVFRVFLWILRLCVCAKFQKPALQGSNHGFSFSGSCEFIASSSINRASDISRGRGPAKFRFFREIPRNSQKNTKYREIRQKYFQIHVGKTYLILILAIRPVLFTPNVQIYLETLLLQRVNNVSKLPGVLRWTLRKTGY